MSYGKGGIKQCPKCNKYKPTLDEFWYRTKSDVDTFRSPCKECCKSKARNYCAKNLSIYNERNKAWRKKQRSDKTAWWLSQRDEMVRKNRLKWRRHQLADKMREVLFKMPYEELKELAARHGIFIEERA